MLTALFELTSCSSYTSNQSCSEFMSAMALSYLEDTSYFFSKILKIEKKKSTSNAPIFRNNVGFAQSV